MSRLRAHLASLAIGISVLQVTSAAMLVAAFCCSPVGVAEPEHHCAHSQCDHSACRMHHGEMAGDTSACKMQCGHREIQIVLSLFGPVGLLVSPPPLPFPEVAGPHATLLPLFGPEFVPAPTSPPPRA